MALGLAEITRRFGFSRPTASTISGLEDNRHRVIELALHWDETLPPCDETERALERLREALMYANMAVAKRGQHEKPLPPDLPPGSVLG